MNLGELNEDNRKQSRAYSTSSSHKKSQMEVFDRQNLLTDESYQGCTNAAVNEDEQNGTEKYIEKFTNHNSFSLDSDFGVGVEPNGDQEESKKGCCGKFYMFNLFKTFDNKFLLALGLQYLNTGMKAMTTLAFLDLFRSQYQLEPTETQSLTAAMTLSWTPKLFYGIISDTFPIFGTRKKSYIMLMGFLQFATAWTIAIVNFESPIYVCVLGFFMNLASAFMDVVVDGLMVMQSRRDQVNGSQDLQTFSWQLLGLGGIIGGISGGLITQYYDTHLIFYVFGFLGFLIMLSGLAMSNEIEAE